MYSEKTPFCDIIDKLISQGYAVCDDFLPAEIIAALLNKANRLYKAGEMNQAKIGKISRAANTNIRGDFTYWLSENSKHAATQFYFTQIMLLKNVLNRQLMMNLHEIEAHLAVYPIGSMYARHLDQFNQGIQQINQIDSAQTRQLSSVLYLNDDWKTHDGGALRLYLPIETLQTHYLQKDTLQKDTLQIDSLQKDDLQKDTLQKDTLQKKDLLKNNQLHDKNNNKMKEETKKETREEFIDIMPVAGRLVLFLSKQFWHEVLPANRTRISLAGWYKSR